MTATDYDGFADSYSADNESSLFNACYERPKCSASPATSRGVEL